VTKINALDDSVMTPPFKRMGYNAVGAPALIHRG